MKGVAFPDLILLRSSCFLVNYSPCLAFLKWLKPELYLSRILRIILLLLAIRQIEDVCMYVFLFLFFKMFMKL